MFKLRSDFPTTSTAVSQKAVEIACCQCKVRFKAMLMRVARDRALHMASILMHLPNYFPTPQPGVARMVLGRLDPNFLVPVVGKSKTGDATIRTFVECDACTASTGIKEAVGELREQLGLIAGSVP
jgi:hypothetical protein